MITKIIEAVVLKGIESGRFSKDEESVYRYGYELLITNVVLAICIAIIVILEQKMKEVLIFLIVFIPLRSYGGGYHTSTAKRCIALSSIVIVIFCMLISEEIIQKNNLVLNMVSFLGIVAVLKYTPRINQGSTKLERQCKKVTLGLYSLDLLLVYILCALGFYEEAVCISLTQIMWLFSLGYSILVKNRNETQ